MSTHDVLIVGGGPAGAACAARLRERGLDCLILDAEPFPRLKLCAGWITPDVLGDLRLAPADYPHRFLTFDNLRIQIRGLGFSMQSRQHSIRRIEFDDWLLKRSGAPVVTHTVRDIRREHGQYVIDGEYRGRTLVGAGGTRCPVYRTLFRAANPRAKELQAVALEEEFAWDWHDPDCYLWFFDNGFPGYSWYVPKQNGWLNIGIGGMASQLKARGEDIKDHWARLVEKLDRQGLVQGHAFEPKGYSYYLRADVDVVNIDNAYLVGDSAGLATRDLCEGIGPAIRSGLLAADAIANGTPYCLDSVSPYTTDRVIVHKPLEYFLVSRERRRLHRAA